MTAPAKAAAKKPAAKKAAPARKPSAEKGNGRALMAAVIAAAKAQDIGPFVEQKSGGYARLQVEGKTVAYVVGGKNVATVYPGTLAASMPKAIRFKKVALGKHHYGSGEVVVPVEGQKDVPNAVAALKASLTAPPAKGRGAKAEAAAA